MKIAVFSFYLPSASKLGPGYQAHYMANAMARRGHEVTMFTPCPPSEGALYHTHNVAVGRSMRTFRFAWELRKVDFSGFDVIHAHGDDYWLWRRRVPCHVKTMHGSCLSEAVHIPGIKEKIRMLALAAGEITGSVVADRTFGVSANTCRSYPWIRRTIPNGVDLAAFRPGQKAAFPAILFVGTYRNRKRGKMLMEVFDNVVRAAIPDARLWMVCEDAPAAPGVEVFGRVPLEQLAELYRKAWVFCLPSSYEGFGVPYIEAMASGTPVVATPNPGAREVLADGKYGLVAEDDQLGTALVRLLQNDSERQKLSAVGIERAAEYGWDRVIGQYEAAYAEIIQRNGARRGAQDPGMVVASARGST